MNKISFLISVTLAMLGIYGCSEQEVVYPDQGNNLNAAFSNATVNAEVEDSDGGIIKVEIVRGNLLNTEAVVGITLTVGSDVPSAANIGLAENTVRFAPGESRKEIRINYNIDALEFFETYPVTLSFTDPAQGPIYGANETSTVKISRKFDKASLVYEDYGIGHFSSEFFEEDWDVELQKAQGAPYFLVKDLYVNGFDIEFVMNKALNQITEFGDQQTGYVHPTYGMISAHVVSASVAGKVIALSIQYYVSAGSFGTFNETLTLP
jgi:hypothetical protein